MFGTGDFLFNFLLQYKDVVKKKIYTKKRAWGGGHDSNSDDPVESPCSLVSNSSIVIAKPPAMSIMTNIPIAMTNKPSDRPMKR